MIFERGYFQTETTVNLNENLRETRMFSKYKTVSKPTVFISHKHSDIQDQKEVKGIIQLFEQLGAKVYIDSMDEKMPNETSGETAARIKEVIEHTNKFVLVATKNAIESYWCNWELGIGDTHKYIEHIAIIPIKEKDEYDSNYKGNEYLQIYPSIEHRDGTTRYRSNKEIIRRGFYVCKPKNKDNIRYITPLKDWLKI